MPLARSSLQRPPRCHDNRTWQLSLRSAGRGQKGVRTAPAGTRPTPGCPEQLKEENGDKPRPGQCEGTTSTQPTLCIRFPPPRPSRRWAQSPDRPLSLQHPAKGHRVPRAGGEASSRQRPTGSMYV